MDCKVAKPWRICVMPCSTFALRCQSPAPHELAIHRPDRKSLLGRHSDRWPQRAPGWQVPPSRADGGWRQSGGAWADCRDDASSWARLSAFVEPLSRLLSIAEPSQSPGHKRGQATPRPPHAGRPERGAARGCIGRCTLLQGKRARANSPRKNKVVPMARWAARSGRGIVCLVAEVRSCSPNSSAVRILCPRVMKYP